MRDINLGDTVYKLFTTRSFSTGAPATLSGTPVLSVYEQNNTTQITSGVSLSVDYDTVTGLNQVTIIATSGNGYEAGKSYDVVITTGTVGGVSVVGEVVWSFTVEDAACISKVWDEAIASHLTAGTLGLASALGSAAIADTTITGTPTSTTIQLTAGSSVDDFYADQLLYILSGTGIGQVRPVLSYNGTTKVITADEAFATTPASGDRVAIIVTHVHPKQQIVNSVLNEATSGHTTAGTVGKAIIDILADTNELQTDDVPGLIAALNNLSQAEANAACDTALTDYDAPTYTEMVAAFAALNDPTAAAIASAVLNTQMAEDYAADGTAPTLLQAIYLIQQMLTDFAIAGTTLSVKGLDGSTVKATFTLDDGTNPTSLTRAT